MGRSPCCDKAGLKKGPWTSEEDKKLLGYIEQHGHGSWRALPSKAGLERCGKSCRLRWTNYLRPDIKRGKFSSQEEQTIIQLHALLGNRWSAIATHLSKRTDNEIKNYWNTHLKKRLAKMGIDPATHKPKNEALLSSTNDGTHSKNASNLSHMAQWESARLEAEARLVRESKLRTRHSVIFQQHASTTTHLIPASSTNSLHNHHHLIKSWKNNNSWSKLTTDHPGISSGLLNPSDLESPTSTLSTFSENNNDLPVNIPMLEFAGSSESNKYENGIIKEEGEHGWKSFGNSSSLHDHDNYKEALENSLLFTSGIHDISISMEGTWPPHQSTDLKTSNTSIDNVMAEEGFTSLLLNGSDDPSLSDGSGGTGSDNGGDGGGTGASDYYEDNKNYWNNILNLVNSSPSNSPLF